MVGGSKRGIGQAGTGTNNHHGLFMVTNVYLDLLITPRGDKGSDRIANGPQARCCHSGSHADGICLRDPGVEKSTNTLCFEFVKKPVSDIGTQHHHAGILHGDLSNFIGKSVSHFNPSSLLAFSISSTLGER